MDWFLYDNGLRHKRVKPSDLSLVTRMSISYPTADLVTFPGEILNGKLHFFLQWVAFLRTEAKAYSQIIT